MAGEKGNTTPHSAPVGLNFALQQFHIAHFWTKVIGEQYLLCILKNHCYGNGMATSYDTTVAYLLTAVFVIFNSSAGTSTFSSCKTSVAGH